jgi:hypothetical protein
MRNRILTIIAACALLIGGGAAVLSQSASAAPENPTLVGSRVVCGLYNGDWKVLDAPCSSHVDKTAPDKRGMWFIGPVPVPGAAGYADSIKAIVGSGGGVGPAGPVGPQGPKGDPGVSASKFIEFSLKLGATEVNTLKVTAPAKTYLIDGGIDALPASVTRTDSDTTWFSATVPPGDAVELGSTVAGEYDADPRSVTLKFANAANAERTVTVWLLVAQR